MEGELPAIVPVILCGGGGTRLWPRSRLAQPKPFLPLLGETTLYQETLSRCADRRLFSAPTIVIGRDHLDVARAQASETAPDARFIVEPVGRNTAAAIGLAAHSLDPAEIMLVCPSDHHILDAEAFRQSAQRAAALAREDWLVSFGIEATSPETGYGYIRRGEPLGDGYRVRNFVEKPDSATALRFLAEGDYAWNGGIFAFRAGFFIEELRRHRPVLADKVQAAFADSRQDGVCLYPASESFGSIEGESVDYAVMENTARAAMIAASMGWSDIGNWDALLRQRNPDVRGNVIVGNGEIIGATGSMIDTDGPHVTIVGADGIVVVVDGDDILVTARESAQRVAEASKCRR